jgi:predicted nucleotidyltransferase
MEERKLIERTVELIKKIKGVQAIFLFGSYASGTQKPISDIDICILTSKHIPLEVKMEITSYSSRKLDISIFWDLPIAVRYNILKKGKLLFNRSEEFLHSTVVETMDKYLDFKHIIDRNIARVFQCIKKD